MSDFYDLPDKNSEKEKENTEFQVRQLVRQVEALRKTSDDPGFKWEELPLFQDIVRMLGPTPPLSLIESLYKHYKSKLTEIEHSKLPLLFEELGCQNIELNNGKKIQLLTAVNFTVKNEEGLLEWFIENGYKDKIKHSFEFKKGDYNPAFQDYLDKNGASYKTTYGIHANTLKATLKEILQEKEKQDMINKQLKKEGKQLPEKIVPLPPENLITLSKFNYCKLK